MARKFYEIALGMHQHPETFRERSVKPTLGYSKDDYELLYPGDIALVEEALVLRPPTMGGWADAQKDGTWAITCARELKDYRGAETRILRDEPSRLAGINVSQAALQRIEREEAENETVIVPLPPVARNAGPTVKRVRTTA